MNTKTSNRIFHHMRNINFNFLFIACVWASTAAADHSFLRSGRKLEWCEDYTISDCPSELGCEVLQRSGQKNLCVDSDDIFESTFEQCSNFDGNERSCWNKYPDCVYRGNDTCENRSNSMNNGCTVDSDCEDDDEICVPFQLFTVADPCLANDFRFGQCIRRPNQCSSTINEVCGCNGETYDNPCESLKDGMNVWYNDFCSQSNFEDFEEFQEEYVEEHNLDDGDYFDEYIWAYMRGSVRTNGDTCLNEFECKKQSKDINGWRNFVVTSDAYNCGCFRDGNKAVWSNHRKCRIEKMRAESLQGSRKRTHCDLNRLYRDIRNVRSDACLNKAQCAAECGKTFGSKVRVRENNNDEKCGCYRRGNKCFWNDCGNVRAKSKVSLPGDNKRVWCNNRDRDVRDIVRDTCLTKEACRIQGEIDGNVNTNIVEKDFGNSDTNCGCYKKGGRLHWATCGANGDFYGPVGEGDNQKERIHCHDVDTRSYRLFGEHSHPHSHPHYSDDHDHDYDYDYDYDNDYDYYYNYYNDPI